MDKSYDPRDIEIRWYQNWEEKGYFKPAGGDHRDDNRDSGNRISGHPFQWCEQPAGDPGGHR